MYNDNNILERMGTTEEVTYCPRLTTSTPPAGVTISNALRSLVRRTTQGGADGSLLRQRTTHWYVSKQELDSAGITEPKEGDVIERENGERWTVDTTLGEVYFCIYTECWVLPSRREQP